MASNPSVGRDDTSRRPSSVTAVAVGLLAVVLVLGLVATPVTAHAYLSETDPSNGEQVETVPDEITLHFSGDGVVNADVTVEGPNGEVVSADPDIDPDDTQIVRVPIEDDIDDEGMYTVDWEVLAEDGHTTSGSFFFAVGDEPLDRDAVLEAYEDGEGEADESVSPLEAGAKSSLLVGVVGLLGIPVAVAVVIGPRFARRESPRNGVAGRIDRLLTGAAVLAALGAFVLGLARSRALGPLSLETLTRFVETPLGQAWLVQVALGAGLVALTVATMRGRLSRRGSLVGVFVGALALAATVAWTSHSATAIDRFSGTVVDLVHLLGAGLWAGGLVVLAFVVAPAVRDAVPDDRPSLLADAIRRFSVLALLGVTAVVTTGFVLASWHVPTADGLTETFYGLILVSKLALIAAALVLGGITRFVLLDRLESARPTEAGDASRPTSTDGGREERHEDRHRRTVRWITRTVRLEVALLLVVVVLSGVLTSAPTAAVAGAGADADEPVEGTIEYEYDDALVELSVLPVVEETDDDSLVLQAAEPIVFEATFHADGDPIESEQPVRLLASDGDTEIEVELEETDDGSYATVQPLPDAGEWDLRLTGAPDGSYVSEWIDATVVSEAGHEHDPDDHEEHEHADHNHDPDDHEEHDHTVHEPDDASPFQTLLEFGAVATAIVGTIGVVVESLRLRDRE
ncbi:copper resistance CopC/CopD family protein [Natronobacterium texcoconense]|uniref:Copper transport protein n=1 Tax=Natronobacterium texcoconense TaxID=1095778 RepID=A0A1H1GF09_NATTX|nr:copper resistance protein CopC [Natronobacterium texcoconense]SDR11685.1 copper transport protein [Natronobacterium texcoconense]